MGYQWVAVSMLTGQLICDLNGLVCQNPQQTIGQYESCTATLPIPTAPPGWQLAVTPGASVIWLLVDAPNGSTVPVWGGYVSACTLDHTDNAQLTLATLETYLDCRYTGTRTYTNEDGNLICQDLIDNCVATGPQGGLPIRVNIVGGAGQAQTISWLDQNDTTVYAALQALTALMGGPEWCITGEWQHNPERITPVFNVGTRLGTPQTPGLSPATVFDLPGNLAGFSTLRSFAQGLGANSVMAYSTGSGTVRPQSPYENQPDPLRPTFEYRWSPSQNVLSVPQLTQWAQAALGILASGSVSLTGAVKIKPGDAQQYGLGWQLGDDIGYQIGPVQPATSQPAVVNLFTNPGFEATSGTVVVRTNFVTDPAPAATTSWSAFGSVTRNIVATVTHGSPTSMQVITAGAGAGEGVSARSSQTSTAGASWSGSVWVQAPAGATLYASVRSNSAGTWDAATNFTGTGAWQQVTVNGNVTNATAPAAPILMVRTSTAQAVTFYVTQATLENAPVAGAPFTSTSSPDPDLAAGVSGGNAVLTGAEPVGVGAGTGRAAFQSSAWSVDGAHSLRIVPVPAGGDANAGTFSLGNLTPGVTYTAVAVCHLPAPIPAPSAQSTARTIYYLSASNQVSAQAPNTAGDHVVRLTFTVDGTETGPRLGGDTADVWWDALTIVQGVYTGPPFTGRTPPSTSSTQDTTYAWTGASDASTSTQSTLTTAPPPVPAFPNGLTGVARVIGFTYTIGNTVSMQVILAGGTLLQFDVQQALNLFVANTALTVGTA